jgi:carbonic anhydrase
LLVHQHVETGDLSVVGAFFEIGEHNEWLATFFDEAPAEEEESVWHDDVDPYAGLPEDLSYLVFLLSQKRLIYIYSTTLVPSLLHLALKV